jgi:hypothetical protein
MDLNQSTTRAMDDDTDSEELYDIKNYLFLPNTNKRGMLVELNYPHTTAGRAAYYDLNNKLACLSKDFEFYNFFSPDQDLQLSIPEINNTHELFFAQVGRFWRDMNKIKNDLSNGKIVVVSHYIFDLMCFAHTHNLFSMAEQKEQLSVNWMMQVVKGLPIPDCHLTISESMVYLEQYFKTQIKEKGFTLELDEECEENKDFQRSILYVTEDTKHQLHRYMHESSLFPLSNQAIVNAVMLTISSLLLDVKYRPLKFY